MVWLLLAVLGLHQAHRRLGDLKRGLRTLETKPLRFHVAVCRFLLYEGAVLVAFGPLVPVIGAAGWCSCGLALIGGMWVPCGFRAVNRHRTLFVVRNVLFALAGIAFIGRAVGQW
ncbi:MAG TPA: hypothetical protein VD862_02610 [Candidatus Paceibacterota bacterium]|nr:hypothetical protein [Candidatus Paceibacterota bacterium]